MNPTDARSRALEGALLRPSPGREAPPDFLFRRPAAEADPTLARLAEVEDERQRRKLILIASESAAPEPVREILGSSFNNLYAEGYPSWRMTEAENRDWADLVTHLAYFRRYSDLRYYRGCEYADVVEAIAQKRIQRLFAGERAGADEIFANVQPLSGAAANNAVYMALAPPGSTVVGMSLVEGGHLTHGAKANRSGKNYRIVSYGLDERSGRIDYEQVKDLVAEHQPRLLIGGASAYPWRIDWERLRDIADSVAGGCFLLADIAHYAGLVVAGQYPNPVGIAHVTSFTTHKSLCGPRGAVILTTARELAQRINAAVFPGEQGGPHVGNIAAKAVAFHLAGTATFRLLMERVTANARALAAGIEKRGVRIKYGGTESHLCLVDLASLPSPTGMPLTGEIAGRLLDLAGIVVNKNTVRGDTSAVHPSAIRLGTVWVSQLGYDERDMDRLAELIVLLLKGAHPFRYIEGAGYVGRGKVDLALLDEVARGVDELVERRLGPATGPRSGYPHFPSSRASVAGGGGNREPLPARGAAAAEDSGLALVEVESERAHYFLDSAGSAALAALGPGHAARTFLLGRDGRRIDDVLVLGVEPRSRGDAERDGWRRYRLLAGGARLAELTRWLRALSDGYVLFDDEDVFRKLEGPAMVEDLSNDEPHAGCVGEFVVESRCQGQELRETPAERLSCVALIGPDAAGILEKAAGSQTAPAPGRHAVIRIGGANVQAAREDDQAFFLICGHGERAAVAAALRAAGAAPGGAGLVDAWRARAALPAADEATDAARLFAARPDLFARTKPYYAGHQHVPRPAVALAEYAPAAPAAAAELKTTPLHDSHVKLGQKEFMVPFGGWRMPVRYGSILDEHQAVRQAAGLFDVAHMGVLEVRGPSAQRFLDAITTNYVAWLGNGQCQYSYLLDPDGGCIDDILVYRRRHDRILLVVNAANAEKDEAWIRACAGGEYLLDRARRYVRADGPVEIVNLKDPALGAERRVDLALQGPRAFDILAAAARNPELMGRLALRKRFEFVEGAIDGIDALVSTTGYTGEKVGFEILVHPDHLVQLWHLLLERGEPFGLRPAGLGARDSTRIEAGYPLWGHELAGELGVTPIEAGYGTAVKFHKPFFVGRDAMRRHDETRTRQIVRFVVDPKVRRMVRAGNPVVDDAGRWLGTVTSATQVGGHQVGMALVERRAAKRDAPLFIYRLPQNAGRLPPPKRMDRLAAGDAVLLPDPARVVRRFL